MLVLGRLKADTEPIASVPKLVAADCECHGGLKGGLPRVVVEMDLCLAKSVPGSSDADITAAGGARNLKLSGLESSSAVDCCGLPQVDWLAMGELWTVGLFAAISLRGCNGLVCVL